MQQLEIWKVEFLNWDGFLIMMSTAYDKSIGK